MTDKERIAMLEQRLANLESRMANIERLPAANIPWQLIPLQPNSMPQKGDVPTLPPYTITCGHSQ